MKTFCTVLIGGAFIGYIVLLGFSALMGDAGILVGAILAIALLAALLVCVLERLTELEDKLDLLLREKRERGRED